MLAVRPAVEVESHDGKRAVETLWPIFRVHHQMTRYVYDMYYRQRRIDRDLYDFCIREKYADGALIAKWKKV